MHEGLLWRVNAGLNVLNRDPTRMFHI